MMKKIKVFLIPIILLLFSVQNSFGQSCSYIDYNGNSILQQRTIISVTSNSPYHAVEYEVLIYQNGCLISCNSYTSTAYTCQGIVTFYMFTSAECSNLGSYTISTNSTCGGGGGGGGGGGSIEFEECCG